jgi:hypothetical protein
VRAITLRVGFNGSLYNEVNRGSLATLFERPASVHCAVADFSAS